MKINLSLLPAAILAAVVICSCNSEKPYTINGVLNVPSEIPYGDTIIQVPSPEGEWVYLVEGDEPIDSCQIIDNRFTFSGKIKSSDAYFAQIASMYCMAMVVIEPGEIKIYSDGNETNVTGTASNDGINSMLFALTEIERNIQNKMMAISDTLHTEDQNALFEIYSNLQQEYETSQASLLDSIYEINNDNLASIYAAVIRHAGDGSAEEFEKAMNEYPERVSQNAFVLSCIRALKAQEEAMGGANPDLDESLFSE